MNNDYIEHYKKNNISPVTQNISDKTQHFTMRTKLYESLGVPSFYFKGKRILEIGSGSGYNALVTASFGHQFYQIVDANSIAIEELYHLFENNNVDMKNIDIQNKFIEEFECEKKFDIIICENMLPCVKNNFKILDAIYSMLNKDGIMIIGCSDEISVFYDLSRRLLGNLLLQKEKTSSFEEKLNILESAFDSHLQTLKGCNRPTRDWCADNLQGAAFYNSNLSISDVIDHFKSSMRFYNMSPSILIDETWYKEIPLDIETFNQQKIDKFDSIWHNLFHYKSILPSRNKDKNIRLRVFCREYFDLIQKYEFEYTEESRNEILKILHSILSLLNDDFSDQKIVDSLTELIHFIKINDISIDTIANKMNTFTTAFGRGMQYLSMIK